MGIIDSFRKIYSLLNKRQRINSIIMLGLIALGGVAETLGIGVILPFTTVLLDTESAHTIPILSSIISHPWVGDQSRFILLMCFALVVIFALKSLYMFFLMYIQNRFTLNRQIELSTMLFKSYIYKPYDFFFDKNTADLQRNVNTLVSDVTQGVLMNGLSMLTEMIVIFFIFALLMFVDPISTLAIALVLCGVGFLYYFVLRRRLDESAKKQNLAGANMVKSVNEGLGSIKDVKVLGREESFLTGYEKFGRAFARSTAFGNITSSAPRLLIETIAVCGLVLIVVLNTMQNQDMEASLPTIALFGMAAMRIMPSLNRTVGFMTAIRFNAVHLAKIYDDLKAAETRDEDLKASKDVGFVPLTVKETVELKDISYRYPNTKTDIFKSAQLTINKGHTIGIVGASGAGKTTLIDILLGLLIPDSGEVLVDGVNIEINRRGFRRNVGYVPQEIFLIDDTIGKNVAFGIPDAEVNAERIWDVLKIANIADYVMSLELGLDTLVGEGGMKLSGGQRQRLGIARALYNDPDILVFDEATSSLDNESEKVISDAIAAIGRSKTMIIIAHRLNTLDKCDEIYEIRDNGIFIQ